MDIVILGSEGCLASGFIGLVDILSLARSAIERVRDGVRPFQVLTASIDGRAVIDGHGRHLDVDRALSEISACAAVIVPGFVPDERMQPPAMSGYRSAAAWIRRQHARGALACGSCSGVYLLGEAGLLDGRRCTTTWWLHDEMKRRYPHAEAAWGAALIEDRRVVSAGGPLSWIDLALHVVRTLCGADAARTAADFAVVDTTPSSQAVYVPIGNLAASDPAVIDAERIVRQAAGERLTTTDLARRLGTSERTLHRRLSGATGESPKQFIDRVRFEMARAALEGGPATVKQVAAAAGFDDEASFRRSFKRFSGMTPGAYRAWAKSRQG